MSPIVRLLTGALTAILVCASQDATASRPRRPGTVSTQILPIDGQRVTTVRLHHIKTGANYELRLYDRDGDMRREVLVELRQFLACPRTGVDHPIHWRLITILHAVAAHWPGRTVTIISGYRHPKHARRGHSRSNHTRGRAIDFRVEGVKNRLLRDTIRASFRGIGVGYYPNSTFVHLDIREHDGQWIDYAGPGEDACYSPDSREDLRSGLAERLSYAQAISRGCKGATRPGDRSSFPARSAPP